MGCLRGCKTYLEYAEKRDKKEKEKIEMRKTRKWIGSERSCRQKILWAEAKKTGVIFGKPISEVIYTRYRKGAEKRKIEFNLGYDEFIKLWKMPCHYCGAEIETIGLDRMDSDKGYTLQNIAPCCTKCNLTKRKMSDTEYIEHCRKVSNHTNILFR